MIRYSVNTGINNLTPEGMKTMVKIDGKKYHYDLERVHYITDLKTGQFIIVKHPKTHELCRVEIVCKYQNGIDVRDASDDLAPFRWYIRKSWLFNQVFLIKK